MARILIEHVDVITLDAEDRLLTDVDLAIDGDTVAAVGEAPPGFRPDEIVDGRHQLALPGLVNAHCHAPMTLERGWAEDLPFPRWLNEKIWVAESALQEEDVYWGAALAACEMIRAGVIGFADHYFWMDQVARVVEESGLRALLAWCVFGLGRDKEVGGVDLETTRGFAQRWEGQAGGRLRTAMGPHSPYMCPPEVLQAASQAARELGIPVHLHLAESDEQVQTSCRRFGRSPVQHLETLGVLEGRVLAAHCIAVDDEDLSLLARRRVSVAHTPKTYCKLAMGLPPLRRMIDAGVPVALGTDGPASNADLSLLEVMRLTGLQQKQALQDAAAFPLTQLLRLGSTAGAQALGFTRSGRLEPGAAADLVLLDTRAPHWFPRHNLIAGVVYTSHPSDVRRVMVDGRWLLRDGELTTLDEERICWEAERRARRMVGQPLSQVRSYAG